MIAPTKNAVTQGIHGTYNAVDYSASPDPNIYAPEDGTILSYGYNGNCGNNLQMNGATGRHGFCHLERATVSAGQAVKKGQIIGIMGYTGLTIPTGPAGRHLHWVLYKNGVYVYPPNYVNETNAPSAGGKIMDTDAKVAAQYNTLRGNTGTAAERASWLGKSYESFNATAVPEINARQANLANLQKQVASQNTQIAALNTKVTALTNQVNTLTAQVKTLTVTIAAKDKEIADLKAQVATGSSEDTQLLNSLGEILRKIIARVGTK